MADDLRKLKDEAAHATEKGKHRKAAELYARVAERERDDAQWPQKAGEALRRAGAPGEALPHFAAAAEVYARQGFSLKAVAMAKVILQIDPRHRRAGELLEQLSRPRFSTGTGTGTGTIASGSGSGSDEELAAGGEIGIVSLDAVGGAPPELALAPGAPIAALPLAEVVAGARRTAEFPIVAYEIPVEDFQIEVAREPPPLPPIPLLSSLGRAGLRRLVEQCRFIERAPGQSIVVEGEPGDALYVVVRGEVEVTVAGRDEPLGHLGEGAFFGELAVLANRPRSATVRAAEPSELLEIDRAVLASLLADDPAVLRTLLGFFRDRLTERLIATSPLFAPFAGDEARALAARFRFLELDAGAALVTEGERASGLFVLLCGDCEVTRGGAPIASIGPGELCGEMSLLSGRPAVATVRSRSRLWALALSRAGFQELISTHPQVLVYVNDVAEQRRQVTERIAMV